MIERGDVEIVKFLLNNPIGLTPQHISIIDFSPKLASVSKYLLECKNIDRVYKLHINSVSVLLMGDLELIKMVLSGVDPSKITITQHMLDIIIGSSQCLEIIEYIHRLPMFPVNRAFISACSIGNLKVVKFLNETFRSTIVVPLDLNSFLDLALHHYHLDIVDYLITNRNLHQGELFNLQSLKRVIIKNDNNLFDLVFKNLDQIYKKDSPKFVMEMVFKNGRLELLHYILTQYKDIDWFCNIELIKLSIGKHHKSIILYWFDKKQKQISETNTSTSILEQLFRESLKLQSRPIAQFFYQELTKRNQSVGVLSRKDLQHILWNKNISIVDYIYNLGLLPKEELLDPSFYLFKISNNLERYLIKKGYTKVWMDHKEYLEHIEIFVSKDKILQGNKSNKQLLLGQQSKYTKEKREEIFGMVFGNHYLLSKILQHTQSFFSTEIKLGKMLSRFEAMQTDRYHYYGMIKQNVPFVISHELVATMFDIDLLENTKRQYPEVFRDETLFTLAIQRSNYVLVEFMLKGDSPFSVDSDLLYSIRSTSRVVYKMVMNHNQCRVIPTLKSLSLLFTVISPNYKYYKKYYQWYYRYETVMKMINNTPGGYPSLENYSTRESIILNQLFNSKNNKRSLNAKHLGLEMLKLINDTNFFPSTFSVGDLMDDAIQRTKKSIVTFLYYNTPHNYTNPLGFYVYPSKNLMEVLRFSNNFLLPKDPVVSVALFENVNNPVVLSYLYQNQFDRNRTQNLISFKGIAKNSNKSIQKFVYENCPQTHLETMHTTALYSIVESNFGYSYSFKYLMERYKNVVYGQSLLTLSTRITQEFYFNYYHRLEQDRDMDMDMETISPIHLDIYGVKILIQNFNMYPIQFESPSDQYILDYYLQVSKNPSSVYELCNYSPLFNLETNFQILKHIPEIIPDFVNQVLHDGDIITYKQLLHYNHNEFGGAVDYGILLSSTSPSHMELFRVVLETDPRLLIFERYFGVCISKDINKYNLLKKMVSSTNRDDINVVNIKVEIIVGALKSKYFEFAMFVILDREFMTNNYINHSKEINDKEWVKLFVDEITLNDKAKIVKEVLSNIYIIPSPVLEFYFDSFRINNSEHDLPAIKATKSKQF